MATINLGAIKFNWRGAYAGGTAYTVDDVVSSSGSSYVCILASTGNATSNGTYWEQMSSAGTNGTDLTSTLSTRGDIVYKGASALERLPKGTAGYYLKQGANDPEWGAISGGGVLQAVHNHSATPVNTSSSSYVATNNSVTITPTASNSKIYVVLNGSIAVNNSGDDPWVFIKVQRSIGGGAYGDVISNWYRRYAPSAGAIAILEDVNFHLIDAPATTSAVIYKVYYHGGGTSVWYGGRSTNEPSSTNGIAIELANGIA